MARKKQPNPVGRPTDYREEYCQELLDFYSVEPYKSVSVTQVDKKGQEYITEVEKPNDLPHLIDFARKIGVSYSAIWDWGKKYPEFGNALKQAEKMNEKMLVVNTLRGLYNPTFAIFTAKNKFGWRDVQEIEQKVEITQIYVKKLFSRLGLEEESSSEA